MNKIIDYCYTHYHKYFRCILKNGLNNDFFFPKMDSDTCKGHSSSLSIVALMHAGIQQCALAVTQTDYDSSVMM